MFWELNYLLSHIFTLVTVTEVTYSPKVTGTVTKLLFKGDLLIPDYVTQKPPGKEDTSSVSFSRVSLIVLATWG